MNDYEIKITQITQDYEYRIQSYQSNTSQEFNVKMRELADANSKLGEYERRISDMGEEITRLSRLLKDKNEESSSSLGQVRNIQQEYERIRRDYADL